MAGLAYSLVATRQGFTLSAAGFSDKLPNLALRVTQALAARAAAPCDPGLFVRAHERLTLTLRNAGHVAASRAREARLECLEVPHFTAAEQLAVLPSLTSADLDTYATAALAEPTLAQYTTVFASGNVSAAQALEFYAASRAVLRLPPDPMYDGVDGGALPLPARRAIGGCLLLRRGEYHCRRVSSTNSAETNSAIELYWQLGEATPALCARLDLLLQLIWEPLFDRLRTKE